MADPNFVILYVKNLAASSSFYAQLLGKQAVDSSPSFVMFALSSGVMLGLWATDGVQPPATPVGGSELAIAVESNEVVNTMHAAWVARGLNVAQAPTTMDFGFTFVVLDPDGHRVRVFAPTAR